MLVELKVAWRSTSRPATRRCETLADVIAFNRQHAEQELPWFGQELLEKAEATEGVASSAYLDAVDACAAAGIARARPDAR